MIYQKKNPQKENTFNLTVQTLKSTVVQYNRWHTEVGTKWTGKKSYWIEERKEVGDGRDEGSSATGNGGQATISLTPDVDEMCVCIFESLQFEGLYVRNLP